MNIIQGDCAQVLKMVATSSVDMVLTSPPYANVRKNCYAGVPAGRYLAWFLPIAREIFRILKPTGSFLLNIKAHCDKGERHLYTLKLVIALKEEVGFRYTDDFIWTKTGMCGKFTGRFKNAHEPVYHFTKEPGYTHNPYAVAKAASPDSLARYNRGLQSSTHNGSGFAPSRKKITSTLALPSNVVHAPQKSNQHSAEAKHPAVYPLALCEFFIKAFTNAGDTVVDPFAGSGTTGVACERLNRQFIGVELDPEYCQISDRRK
jgi:DNA modification methylase